MFPYFGSKKSTASRYPDPRYPLVIEPFAGSLAYSMHYRPDRVVGVELDERVVALWERMLTISGDEQPPEIGSLTDDLLVKMMGYSEHGLTSATNTVTSRMLRDWASLHRRWAATSGWVEEHVRIIHGSYQDAEDAEATWFIDPPYQYANRRGYAHGASGIDFSALGEWCRSRRGQVIVCEQEGADWLPFVHLGNVRSHRGATSSEVIWTNDPEF